MTDMAPPLLAEEKAPPTFIKLNPKVIHTIAFPRYDSRGQAGFHHLSALSTSLLSLR
jgi:hypothetical protein